MGAVADLDEASARGLGPCAMEWPGVAVGVAVACRRRRSAARRRLDCNHHWRPCLEEAYCRVGSLRRLDRRQTESYTMCQSESR